MSRLTPEHYVRFLAIRKYQPTVIGPLWVKANGHYLGPIQGPGAPEFIAPDELAVLIDKLYRGQQLEFDFAPRISVSFVEPEPRSINDVRAV